MKNKNFKKVTSYHLIGIFLLLNSCHFNNQYLDREQDKNEAENVSNVFYTALINDKINKSAFDLFSNKFWKTTDKDTFKTRLVNVQEKLGKLKEVKLDHWNTKVIEGSNPTAKYELYYLNTYEKYKAKETITLEKENNDIKIIGYNVNSDGFLIK